jgi:hypothetical protein
LFKEEIMPEQIVEKGLSPVRIPEGETYVYCSRPGCGQQISVRISGANKAPYYIDPDGNPLCEGCVIEH